jgi:hydroxypyruvate isomerase
MYSAANIEWLFAAEHPDFSDRIRAAKAAGLDAVEFWLWRDKDINAIKTALDETGVRITCFSADPRRSLVDPAQHSEVLDAVRDSLAVARELGSPMLIIASGMTIFNVPRRQQHDAAVAVLRKAAAMAAEAGITLVLEPLNTQIELPGMYLGSTSEGLDIVAEVDSPNLRLLFDVYHSAVNGEQLESALFAGMPFIGYIQVADVPGRQEPGTGTINWSHTIRVIKGLGYNGAIGLECKASGPSVEALARSRKALGF